MSCQTAPPEGIAGASPCPKPYSHPVDPRDTSTWHGDVSFGWLQPDEDVGEEERERLVQSCLSDGELQLWMDDGSVIRLPREEG